MSPKIPKCVNTNSKPHMFCPGCGHGITLKLIGEAIDELKVENKTVFLVDIGCSLLAWDYFNLPSTQTHHGRTTATAVGYKIASPESLVIAYMGDGGGYAIGLQNLIHACLRNTPISVILINNANYGMTGGQAAPTTFNGQITETTPSGKNPEITGKTIYGPELLKKVAWENAFIARGSVRNPLVLKGFILRCLKNQLENKAFSFLEVLSFCPTNWKTDAEKTMEFIKKMEAYFPVGEIKSK